MADQTLEIVNVERHGDVALIIFNRPEKRNALNPELATGICDAIAASQDCGAIVLTGRDPAFCAGFDLRMGDARKTMPPLFDTVRNSAVPIIAAVNGAAVTGGLIVAASADFIVASERATFADTEVLVQGYGSDMSMITLPRLVGRSYARRMVLTNNFLDAATALRVGLVTDVVAHDELIPFALAIATEISERDRDAVAAMRRVWDETEGVPIDLAQRIHRNAALDFVQAHSAFDDPSRVEAIIRRSTVQRRAK